MPVTPTSGRLTGTEKFEASVQYIRPVWVLLQDPVSKREGWRGCRGRMKRERGRKGEKERKHTLLKCLIIKSSRNVIF